MSRAFNKISALRLGRAGNTTLEFALVASMFFALIFGVMDLGRYFITRHSVLTLTSELVRATMVQCAGSNTACTLSAANITASESVVPMLTPDHFTASPTASRTAINSTTGMMTITASVSYPFTFLFPVFTTLSGNISNTTQLSY
jgi:Flp pilus assembly protein TadG